MLFFKNKDHDLNTRGAYLHLLTDALMVLVQVDDIAIARSQVQAAGARVIEEVDMPGKVAMSHIHPKDIGGAILSVDQMFPPAGFVAVALWRRWLVPAAPVPWVLGLLGLAYLVTPFGLFGSEWGDARLPPAILCVAIAGL
eukprot:gene51770-70557_t